MPSSACSYQSYHPSSCTRSGIHLPLELYRLLLQKADPKFVRFRWEHACSLSALTLSILLKHQGASIHALDFREYTRNWGKADLANLNIGGLTTLGMTELGSVDSMATELLARNHHNLRHLRLASEVDLVTEYAKNGHLDSSEFARLTLTDTFAETMRKKVAALKERSAPVMQLESLSLIGYDLSAFVSGMVKPTVDFNSLSMLTLESCAGLEVALPWLTGTGGDSCKAKRALWLHTLAIRHENVSNEFLQGLEDFLRSLKPLAQLHVLLEGEYDGTIELCKVLRVHGKSLRSLIWDERSGPRRDVAVDNTIAPMNHKNLEIVSKHCPGLKALGISLDWMEIVGFKEYHKKVNVVFGSYIDLHADLA